MSIIIEGPDGAGKTALINQLHRDIPALRLHARFVEPQTGRKDPKTLFNHVYSDDLLGNRRVIYDRHPCISEYIYSHVLDRPIADRFISLGAYEMQRRLYSSAHVVFCLPPFDVVQSCVGAEDQMAGVEGNIDRLYRAYEIRAVQYMGPSHIYDWTETTAYQHLLSSLKGYVAHVA
ncbi:thymidylate kinase [Gordonia phage Mayweather]|uniref:Polynucleotide kinase n=1 Tax=Gordonia phage Mayweather TaxID=2590931 RepID=A0A516KU49_9CAUD|nr:thymidylate kinase [Gordonia phage Mayweather]QDP45221.1 polynucleotide kinase [Gordonia phage Mayweather]